MDIANGDTDNGLIAAVPAVAQLEDPASAPGIEQRTQYEPESAVVTGIPACAPNARPDTQAYGITDAASGIDYTLTNESLHLGNYARQ